MGSSSSQTRRGLPRVQRPNGTPRRRDGAVQTRGNTASFLAVLPNSGCIELTRALGRSRGRLLCAGGGQVGEGAVFDGPIGAACGDGGSDGGEGFVEVGQTFAAGTALGSDSHWWQGALVGLTYVSYHLCSGGLMLAAFFLANDMATRPTRLRGQIIFGLGAGVLTIAARIHGGWPMAPLGAYGALLVMNTFAPLIDWLTRSRPPGK